LYNQVLLSKLPKRVEWQHIARSDLELFNLERSYRTMCLAPSLEFRLVLQQMRDLRLAA